VSEYVDVMRLDWSENRGFGMFELIFGILLYEDGVFILLDKFICHISDHFVWWKAAQPLLLFWCAVSWGPHVLVQCITVNIRVYLPCIKKILEMVLFGF
jgi:hypothetical protein